MIGSLLYVGSILDIISVVHIQGDVVVHVILIVSLIIGYRLNVQSDGMARLIKDVLTTSIVIAHVIIQINKLTELISSGIILTFGPSIS